MKTDDKYKKVSVVFSCKEKDSTDFKIRLRYDNLKQGEFFNSLLQLYISKDPTMLSVVENIKSKLNKMGKNKLKKTNIEYEKGENMLTELGISDSDKSYIYDMIQSTGGEHED